LEIEMMAVLLLKRKYARAEKKNPAALMMEVSLTNSGLPFRY